MTVQFVQEYIDEKIKKDEDYIVCSYYDLRVNKNLSEEEMYEFLNLAKNKLQNIGYKVYFKGEKFWYKGNIEEVKEYEQMIAIK